MHRRPLLAFAALLVAPCAVWPQGNPLGPEFRVNTYTTGNQRYPSVARDPSGNFVVVWHSYPQDGDEFGVFGQRYAGGGTPVGPEFRVNTYTTSNQFYASVASDSTGNFVVVWDSFFQDGSGAGVFGQRYDSTGAPLGPEFPVNTYTTGIEGWSSIAATPSGNFIVVWTSYGQDGSGYGIFCQRYANNGAPLGPEFRVNTFATNSQKHPAVASDASGNFVVVWHSNNQDGSAYGIFGQRYGQIVPVELMHFGIE